MAFDKNDTWFLGFLAIYILLWIITIVLGFVIGGEKYSTYRESLYLGLLIIAGIIGACLYFYYKVKK